MAISISIATQKGGSGKSKLSVLVASMLYYKNGYNTLFCDCDNPQYSSFKLREREKQAVLENEKLKQAFSGNISQCAFNTIYPITQTLPTETLGLNTDNFDVVINDMPGSVNVAGVLQTLLNTDYVFVPIKTDPVVIEGALEFIFALQYAQKLYAEQGNPCKLKQIFVFWNYVNNAIKTPLYEKYNTDFFKSQNIGLLETKILNRVKFDKEIVYHPNEIFVSTMFPAKDYNIECLTSEIIEICALPKK
jgi:cellulose biosynthesis protein BcsQ